MPFLAGLGSLALQALALGLRRGFVGASSLVLTGGDLIGRGLGHQGDRLRRPVVILDLAVELERLVDLGDVVVGEIGDLLELDQPELVQLRLELGRDAGDQLQIVGRALGLGEALEGLALLVARSWRSGMRAALPRRPRR